MDGEISFGERKIRMHTYQNIQHTMITLTLWEHIELLMAARGSEMGSWEERAETIITLLFE